MKKGQQQPYEVKLCKVRQDGTIFPSKKIILQGRSAKSVAQRIKSRQDIISIKKVKPEDLFNIDKDFFI